MWKSCKKPSKKAWFFLIYYYYFDIYFFIQKFMARRRQTKPTDLIISNARDYAVPIVIVLIFLFLGLKLIGWGDSEWVQADNEQVEQDDSQKLSLDGSADAIWEIEFSGWDKVDLTEKDWLYPGEQLIVEAGDITMQDGTGLIMKLDTNWELSYETDGWYSLTSSNLFVKNAEAMNLKMRFLNIALEAGSVVSLNQNEVASTVYVLSGTPQVSTFANKSIDLKAWEKISISSIEAADDTYDIDFARQEIDNYFFSENWAQSNNLETYLNSAAATTSSGVTGENSISIPWETNSITDGTGTGTGTTGNLPIITIEGITDGETYYTPEIEMSGKINSDEVASIQFWNVFADVNLVAKTYLVAGFAIPLKTNDVVYKVFDAQWNVLKRWIYTVYNSVWADAASVSTWTSAAQVAETNFPVATDNETFKFTAPTPNPYTTAVWEDFVTIRGSAAPGSAASVSVNGQVLNSFDGTTWRFHATPDFNTMKQWVNLYKVNYFDNAWAVVHTNTFTIIKN